MSFKFLFPRLGKFANILSYTLFGVCLATLIMAFYIPLYIDDIMNMIVLTRAGYDNWYITGVRPLCKNNFESAIPITLLPGRFLSWLAFLPISTPQEIRLYGIGIFVCWLSFFIWMGKKSFLVEGASLARLALALSFMGVFPFLVTLNRPEPSIAIAITFFALLPFYLDRRAIGKYQQYSLIILVLLVASWFFSQHPKTLFFAPLVFYALFKLRGSLPLFWIASPSIMTAIQFQAYELAKRRFDCPDSSNMQQFISSVALPPGLLWGDPELFIKKFLEGVAGGSYYFQSIFFAPLYGSGWLPPASFGALHSAINLLLFLVIVCVLGFCLLSTLTAIIRSCRQKKLSSDVIVPLLLITSMILTAGFQQSKNFYDVIPVWLPLICLTCIFFFQTSSRLFLSMRPYVSGLIYAISIASQLLLIDSFRDLPDINKNAGVAGDIFHSGLISIRSYHDGFHDMVFHKSASILDYDKRREAITHLAARCDIAPQKPNRYLIIDMFTYLIFKESYRPVFVEHLENQIASFAKNIHSTGLITLCGSLPADLQEKATREDGFCCIGKNGFDNNP